MDASRRAAVRRRAGIVPWILWALLASSAAEAAGEPGEIRETTRTAHLPEGPVEIILKGPGWSVEMADLRRDLEDLFHHWKDRLGPSGRFAPADTGRALEDAPPAWAESFAPVEPWPAYLDLTGDQEIFGALLALCFAFGDAMLGLDPDAPSAPDGSLPAELDGAVEVLVSTSYLLVPGGPALNWLRAVEDRWDRPREDPLTVRLGLALLRQERTEERSKRIEELVLQMIDGSVRVDDDPLEEADLLLDLAAASGPRSTDLLQRARGSLVDLLAGSAEPSPERTSLLAEVFLRYRSLAGDESLDEAAGEWVGARISQRGDAPLPLVAAAAWILSEGDAGRLAEALRQGRESLSSPFDRLRGEPGGLWDGERIGARDAAAVLALAAQGGLGTRRGRVSDVTVRYRDAGGVLGLLPTVAAWVESPVSGESLVSIWQTADRSMTIWVEPAGEGSVLGTSWWEVTRRDDAGDEVTGWSQLPYFRIGRVGPLVLGPRKPLRLRMKWAEGESYLGQWTKPYVPKRLAGPPSAATR
jgi:hypothetical protein